METLDLFIKNILVEARNFALENHKEQKYGMHDYIYHLDEVYEIAKEFNLDYKYQIAAYTHDLLEDTKVTQEQLRKKFGDEITEMTFAVSGFGLNRKEKKEDIICKLKKCPNAINLKMIDRLANMRSAYKDKNERLLNMYLSEIDDYKEVFSLGNKEIHHAILMFKSIKAVKKNKI